MPYIYNPFTENLDYYGTPPVLSGTISDHGQLTGRSDDDHPQYHTNVRGDVRYYTKTSLNSGQLDTRYYTETEVDTISGSLQTNIDGKSDTGHTHTEANITDLDKYTQVEVNTISGALSTEIDSDVSTHSSSADHDGRYYTETEVDALTWTESDITDLDKYTQAEVDFLITTISGELDDHNELNNLDYASSGHTGFASSTSQTTLSGNLQTNIDGKSDSGHTHDDRYYTESEVDALTWTESDITDLDKYTQAEVNTISGALSTEIDSDVSTHSSSADHDGRYYTETEVDALTWTESDITDLDKYTQAEVDTISGSLQTNIDGKDAYTSWSFAVDGVTKDAITSGDVLNFVGGDNIAVTRSADDEITISGVVGLDGLEITDGTDTHIIKTVQEPGLGGRLTFGLDETTRTMVICDAGDVDTDLGLSAQNYPSLYIFSPDLTNYTRLRTSAWYSSFAAKYSWIFNSTQGDILFRIDSDLAIGPPFSFTSIPGTGLTDANAEQSWLYIESEIKQSATAAYNGLKIKVIETSLGDASTGDGGGTNNLILAGTSTDPDMFKVDNVGRICISGSSDPISGNNVGNRDYNDTRYLNTYETTYIDAAAMIPCTTNGALQGTNEYSTNDIDMDYFAFDGGATEERVQFKLKMPENWNLGTIKVKFDWSSATGSTAGDTVEWAIKAGALSDSDAIDAALGIPQVISDILLANNGIDLQTTAATPALTVGGSPAKNDLLIFEIYRNTGGTDDCAEDGFLFGCTIQYKTSGSTTAW